MDKRKANKTINIYLNSFIALSRPNLYVII